MQTFTEKFLDKIHTCFNELHYHYDGKFGFSLKEFIKCATYTLNRCETLKDAKIACQMIAFINKKHKKIHKKIINNYDYWQTFYYADNDYLNLVSEEEATDSMITNCMVKKDIVFSSSLYEDQLFKFSKTHGGYVLDFEDFKCPYIAKTSRLDSSKGSIVDRKFKRKFITNISLDEKGNFTTLDNKGKYEIIAYKEGVGVYPKAYIHKLKKNQEADDDKLIAFIRWDLIDKKSKYSISKIEFYEELNDKDEMYIYMIAILYFVMYQRFVKSNKAIKLLNGDN